MLNCKDASKLASDSLDRKLPFWQWVNLWAHLCLCRLCRGFRKSLVQIREETQRHAEEIEGDLANPELKLSDESRERMKRAIQSWRP